MSTSMYRRFILASVALGVSPVAANAVGFMTQLNCASDYYAYCSKHAIGSPGVRKCMRANGQRLSKACINALIADGEITKAEVEREKTRILAARAQTTSKADAKKKTVAAAKLRKAKPAAAEVKLARPDVKANIQITTNDTARTLSVPKPKPAVRLAALETKRPPTLKLDGETFAAFKARGSQFVVEEPTYVVASIPSSHVQSEDSRAASIENAATKKARPQISEAWATTVTTGNQRSVSVAENEPMDDAVTIEPQTKPIDIPTRTVRVTVVREPPARQEQVQPAIQKTAQKMDYSYGRMGLGLGLSTKEKTPPEPSLWSKIVAFFSRSAAD